MAGKTISTSETKIEALKLQSSAYGVTVPLVYGVNRIPGNMLWYGDFRATPHTSQTSGKGGGAKNTTFSYSASVMLGLCEGQIAGIARIWKGKVLISGGLTPSQLLTVTETYTGGAGSFTVAHSAAFAASISCVIGWGADRYTLSEGTDYTRVGGVYTFLANFTTVDVTYQYVTGGGTQTALQQLGLSLAYGAIGQATWSYLTTNFSAQAIGYSGLAYVYAQDYPLASDASVDNHIFEVQGPQAFSISTSIPDANPASVTADVLINARYGAAFASTFLGQVGAWSSYCLASGLFVSPAMDTQMKAGDFVALMGKLTNTAPLWSGGKLSMIPYGDAALSGNGATYTPNLTPVYDLGDDDFVGGGDPIKVERLPQADAFNHIRVEFLNRANAYNVEIAEAKDSASIDAFGLRSAAILSAHWICDAAIARTVAQLVLQRGLFIRNTYAFTLTWVKALLEPMDLVTLTDAGDGSEGLQFNKLPVRITEINESETGDLAVIAEDFPIGIATASLYASQVGAGYAHDYNASPGGVSAPVIFEAPGALTVNGLELCIAATGLGAKWGGCHVWVSLDGTNYKQVATMNGGSRYGTLSASCGASGTVPVALLAGVLTSGTAADAAALNTLCFIRGSTEEYIAFETATLTSALHYDLAGAMVRGAYGTAAAAHSSADKFVRVDTAIAKSGPIDLGYVGKTVHVKLTSFNIYGGAEEDLASVTDYTYAITGAQVYGNAGAAALAGITAAASDNILTAGEKPPVILDYTNLTGEQAGIDAAATAHGVSSSTYDADLAALTTYLATLTSPVAWNDLTGNTTIVGTTFRSTWAAVYAARQALLNAIASLIQTGQIAPNAATEVYVDTPSVGVTVTGRSHIPDGFNTLWNTLVDSITFTPTISGMAQVFFDARGAFTAGASASGPAWSIQDPSGAYDGWKVLGIGVAAAASITFSMGTTRSFPVTGGVSYTLGVYAHKVDVSDSFTIDNIQMRVEVVKR